LRERFDAGTGLVAIGAVLLLVSLFIDWYKPGGDAWAVFESLDLALAAAAICGLLAVAPRFGTGTLGRALPVITCAAFAIVAVQLIDPPPVVSDSDLATGAWLALAATALMAGGSLLGAASISVTVDVRGRERRRRAAAIDAREGTVDAAEEPDDEPVPPTRRFARSGSLFDAGEPEAPEVQKEQEPAGDPERTQTFDPIDAPKEP
jgi:hypothetical protein